MIAAAKGGVIAAVPGIADRDAAEALRGLRLYVPRERLPATEEDEFYHEDLVGLAARDPTGRCSAGWWPCTITVPATSSRSRSATGRTELVPFTRAAVPVVDLAAGTVEVVLP